MGVNMNDYLLALQEVPEPVLQKFKAKGWTYTVDFEYMAALSKKVGMSCIGATSYADKTIYISSAKATLHEFGHFIDGYLGFPSEHQSFFKDESQAASAFLRDYAQTNCHEYYADYFVYRLRHHNNEEKAAQMQQLTPATFSHFNKLAESDWTLSHD